jgi:hypothetical protein
LLRSCHTAHFVFIAILSTSRAYGKGVKATTSFGYANRDLFASTLEDLFDFDHSPSLDTTVGSAAPPVIDCTPK